MKKFMCQFTLCLALLSLFCSAIPAKAIVMGNTSSYDITLEEINIVNKLNNINTEETVEVFNHGQEKIYITQCDIDLMAKLVYAESRGEPFEGKVAVASVVLIQVSQIVLKVLYFKLMHFLALEIEILKLIQIKVVMMLSMKLLMVRIQQMKRFTSIILP